MSNKLTKAEALRALADGKKIRKHDWFQQAYMHLVDDTFVDMDGLIVSFDVNADWELYRDVPTPLPRASSLEEALKAKKLKIYWPEYITKVPLSICNTSDYILTLPLLHAAISLPDAQVLIEA